MKSKTKLLSLLLTLVMLLSPFGDAAYAVGQSAKADGSGYEELQGKVEGGREVFSFNVPEKKTSTSRRVRRNVPAQPANDTVVNLETTGLGGKDFDWDALPNQSFKLKAKWQTKDGQKHEKEVGSITKDGVREFNVGWPIDGTMDGTASLDAEYDQNIKIRVLFSSSSSEGAAGKLTFKITLQELANPIVNVSYVDPYGKELKKKDLPAGDMPNITSDDLTDVSIPLPKESKELNVRDSEDIDEDELAQAEGGVEYKVADKGDGEKITIGDKEYKLSVSGKDPKNPATISVVYQANVFVPERGDDGEYPAVPDGYVRLTFDANEEGGSNGRFNSLNETKKVVDVKDGLKYNNEELKQAIAALQPEALTAEGLPDEKKVFEGWKPEVPTDETAVVEAEYKATYGNKNSEQEVIPYVPADPTDPTNPDDNNVPKKDDDGKPVDKSQYVIVAFKVDDKDKDKGSLTLGEKEDQQVISALVKKESTWDKVQAPNINVKADTVKANGWKPAIPAGTEKVVDKSVYVAQFITDGQEITPGTELPEGVYEVKVLRDETSVKDNALYGKSYAVFENSKLAQDKFPTPEPNDGYKDAGWNVKGNPWDQAITKATEFKATATNATFDKQDITKVEIIKDPTKMSYTEGDKPNHDGIKVKLTDKNGNTVEIGKDQLQEYGVTVSPTEATDLTVKDHNGHPFTASVTGKDGQPVTGNGKANITVVEKQQPAKPTVENPAAKNEKGKDSTTVTGTTTPHTEVVVTDKDGKEIGRGTSGDDGTFTIETNPKQDAGTEVTITPNGGVPAKATVTEDAPDQSATPTVNRPTEGDTTVTGRGVPDAVIVVTDKDGKVIGETTVGKDGNWTVDVPKDRPLKPGETITVTQTEKDKAPATTQTTVKGKDNGGNWFINLTPVTSEDAKRDTGIHKLYIYGYEDDTFKPEGNMTRAEAAAMLARLQGLDLSNTERPGFIDVRSGWYNASINAVVSAGYMKGYPDGTFRPDGKITRAEFAQMIKAIDKANTGVAPFADVKGHWAEVAIDQAYANGRIAGYPDGTFRPNNHITRAEAVTVFNKLYDRSVNEIGLADVRENLVEFKDVSRGHWAYNEIVESSNTHEFYRTEKGKVAETWTRVLQTWKAALANR